MTNEDFTLEGKNAVVIGGSTVLGRACAVALAEAGANVAVATTTRAKNEEVVANSCANEVWALDRKGFAMSIEATDETDVRALLTRAEEELGRVDILVNAPDLPFAKPIEETSLAEYRRVVDANLASVFLACRVIGLRMVYPPDAQSPESGSQPDSEGKGGRIINVATVLGERGMANGAAYCAAQAGILNLTRALALEWARTGVTVNAVGAGWTEGMPIIGSHEDREKLARYLPHRRLAEPAEIAGAAVYLASDASSYVTGQVLWIEGGALSHV